jgi:HEAT repeat protein
MSLFAELLAVGDLRSDGLANEVAEAVCSHLELLPELIDALQRGKPSVRGHAADALEKVARKSPRTLIAFLGSLARQAQADEIAMVRWHLAMIMGHLAASRLSVPRCRRTLIAMLADPSPFVRCWAISSLAIIARQAPDSSSATLRSIAPLTKDRSPAVAKRARTAVRVLPEPGFDPPSSWIKT